MAPRSNSLNAILVVEALHPVRIRYGRLRYRVQPIARRRPSERATTITLASTSTDKADASSTRSSNSEAPLAQAFGYALRNWDVLVRYTESGVLVPDNNAIAVGRSNYLFAGSARGGHAAAAMYSLIGTAKLNGLNPYRWLKDVLARLPSYPINRVAELLPLANYQWA